MALILLSLIMANRCKVMDTARKSHFVNIALWIFVPVLVLGALYLFRLSDKQEELAERDMRVMAKAAHQLERVLDNIVKVGRAHERQLETSRGRELCRVASAPHPHLALHSSLPDDCADLRYQARDYQLDVQGSSLVVIYQGAWTTAASEQPARLVYAVELDRMVGELVNADKIFESMHVLGERGAVIATPARHVARPSGQFVDISGLLRPTALQRGAPASDVAALTAQEVAELHMAAGVREVSVSGQAYELFSHPVRLPAIDHRDPTPDEPGAAQPRQAELVLCGLRAASSASIEALALSPLWALALAFCVVIALIITPALKILLISRRERLHFKDVLFLGISAMAIIVLITLITLAIATFDRLRWRSAQSLKSLAGQVEERFTGEIESLYGQLQSYDDNLCQLLDAPASSACLQPCLEDPSGAACKATDLLAGTQAAPRCLDQRLALPRPGYPYFEQIAWIRPDGQQFAKAAIGRHTTAPVHVDKREYFQSVRRGRAWTPRWQPGGPPFYVEGIRSITDGEIYGILSMSSCACSHGAGQAPLHRAGQPGACPPWDNAVVSMTFRPMFADHPVLPPGVGFAVVDSEGRVHFHSDERRAVDEVFLDEVASRATVQAALYARTRQSINTEYHGRPHQLFVQPVSGLPWFVIAFSDDDMVQTAGIEVLSHALILAFPYVLFILFVFAGGAFLLWRTRLYLRLWRWSAQSERAICRDLTGLFAVLLAAFIALVRTLPEAGGTSLDASVYVCWLVPMMAVLLAGLRVGLEGNAYTRPSRYRSIPWHLSSAVLLWIILAVVPAYGFFRVALEDQMRNLVKYENRHVADALEDRTQRIRAYYDGGPERDPADRIARAEQPPGPSPGASPGASIVAERLAQDHDIYWFDMFLAGAHRPASERMRAPAGADRAPELGSSGMWSSLARYKPNYTGDALVRMRFLHPAGSADGNDRWQRLDDGRVLFTRRHGSDGGEDGALALVSGLPLAAPPLGGSAPGSQFGVFLGWLGGALIMVFAVVYGTRRVLFHGLDQRLEQLDGDELERLMEGENTRPVLVMVASSEELEHFCTELGAHAGVDLDEVCDDAGRAEALRRVRGARGAVVTTHLDNDVHDRDIRLAKLSFLEEMIAQRKRGVVLVAPFAPFPALFGARSGGAAGDSGPDEDEKRRWGGLLGAFQVTSWPVWLGRDTGQATEPTEPLWLQRELDADHALRSVLGADEIARLRECSKGDGLGRIVDVAEGYYWALWMARSEDEKLALVQLAEEGFVNPKQMRTLRRLARLGLLRRDPILRLMNESFALFVKRVYDPAMIARLENPAGEMGWRQFRVPFLALVFLAVGFLVVTQQDKLNTYMGAFSALAVSLPAIVKLMGMLMRGRGGAAE